MYRVLLLSNSYKNYYAFDQCGCTHPEGLYCKRSNGTNDRNIEDDLNVITSEFTKLEMSLPLILSCLLAICVLYIAGECCFRSGICAKKNFSFPPKNLPPERTETN